MDTGPEARVVASFTFIVALLLGAWGSLDHLVAGPSWFLVPEPVVGRFLVALLPVAATAVAFQAGKAAEPAWARTLGGAAVMLGALSSLGAALYFLSMALR